LQNDQVAGNAGFLALHNPLGVMIVCFSALLLISIIAAGGIYIRHKMEEERAVRETLRNQLRERSRERVGP
jgi:hypothetical protein